MLMLLHQSGCERYAEQTALEIARAFSDAVDVTIIAADAPPKRLPDSCWDDLLVVFFKDTSFPSTGCEYVANYLKARNDAGRVLPIATGTSSRVPPEPISSLKALQYGPDSAGVNGRIVHRVGAMLNLRLQGRDAKIFLSHRASDGAKIAAQLHRHMVEVGYRPWLDEAKDIDDDTMILPGTPVQNEIDKALAEASLVLLLDTPAAPQSRWIKHEIDSADGLLVPILPICFRSSSDKKIGPRFQSLLALQRWVALPLPDVTSDIPLTDGQLEQITREAEEYLCEILRRKCRVPFLVQKEFQSKGFSWNVLDSHRLMYRSSKSRGPRLTTEVLNHCSIFDQIYAPALKAFCGFLHGAPWAHHPLFVYDGELLPEVELLEIIQSLPDERVIILHHQELAALIASDFTVLGSV